MPCSGPSSAQNCGAHGPARGYGRQTVYSPTTEWKVAKVLCEWRRNRQESCAIAKMTARCALYRPISGSNPLRRYDHSKLSKMAACRQLLTGNSTIRSADPENPTLEPNMKYIGSPVAEIWPFAYLGAYGTPIFYGEGEIVGVSNGTIRKSGGGFL